MSVDGLAEQAATLAHLSNLVGGRILEGVPDAETHTRFTTGDIKPYIWVLFGVPFPASGAGTLTAGDADTPHKMTCTVTAYAADFATAKMTAAAAAALLRDWAPDARATPYTGFGGPPSNAEDARKKPSRFDVGYHFTCIINM